MAYPTTNYDEFDAPAGHPTVPGSSQGMWHRPDTIAQPIDPLGGTPDPAAAVVGADKKGSIKEYLEDIKAQQAGTGKYSLEQGGPGPMNAVPSFSNVTGSQVGQNVAGFADEQGQAYDPAQVQSDPSFGGAGEFNMNEYQQAPPGEGAVEDPMGARGMMPGENFADTPAFTEQQQAELDRASKAASKGTEEGYVDEERARLMPGMLAELGIVDGIPPTPEQIQQLAGMLNTHAEKAQDNYRDNIEKAFKMISSGDFDEAGVREYIDGDFKDPSLIKRVVAGPDYLMKLFIDSAERYPGNDPESMKLRQEYAKKTQAAILELIKEGDVANAMKEDLGIGGDGVMPTGPKGIARPGGQDMGAGPVAAGADAPPMRGAKQAEDGKWYIQQNGKWFMVE